MKLLKIGLIAQVYEKRAEEQTNMFQSTLVKTEFTFRTVSDNEVKPRCRTCYENQALQQT
jgi:hypothetical protein